jgi:lysozyme family protein
MASLPLAMPYLIKNEGGYTDKPVPTNWGIEPVDLALYLGAPVSSISADDIRTLSLATATAIYLEQFWNPMNLNLINDQNVATCIFDTGVNRGISVGAIYAQKICQAWGNSKVIMDGKLGPITADGVNRIARSAFIRGYEQLVWAGYEAILAHNPQDAIYRDGWERRAERLLTLI